MAKGRFKDSEFDLADSQGNVGTWEKVGIAALYDIRDELKRLNALLHCSNFVQIPGKLDRIEAAVARTEKNTRKKRKPRAVGKPALRVVSR
jgi:hypothetical protein